MAKNISLVVRANHKKKRKGIHSKNRNSHNKNSKTYQKKYRGQGR